MLSIVEVKCPHCGIHGQILLPPLGAIIVGPCPNCNGIVVVFDGQVLPLSKEILVEGDLNQKAAHLRTVIMDYLANKINRVAERLDDQVLEGLHDYTPEPKLRGAGPITEEEIKFFRQKELPHIDESRYFRHQFDD